jgi:hypothetical protein
MELLTQEIRDKLPPIKATEGQGDPLAIVKLFHPMSNWTWYIVEFDGSDECYGLVIGFERELGYFSLRELEAIGKDGKMLPIERDLYFKPTPLSQIP